MTGARGFFASPRPSRFIGLPFPIGLRFSNLDISPCAHGGAQIDRGGCVKGRFQHGLDGLVPSVEFPIRHCNQRKTYNCKPEPACNLSKPRAV